MLAWRWILTEPWQSQPAPGRRAPAAPPIRRAGTTARNASNEALEEQVDEGADERQASQVIDKRAVGLFPRREEDDVAGLKLDLLVLLVASEDFVDVDLARRLVFADELCFAEVDLGIVERCQGLGLAGGKELLES